MSSPFDKSKILVVYGRNPVYEALLDESLRITKLHLADSNRPSNAIKEIVSAAEQRSITIEYKDRRKLSFITRNAKQDQGVAADVYLKDSGRLEDFGFDRNSDLPTARFILLEGVTNPQNLGMIVRSIAAAGTSTLILPKKGCADLGPLVIKASAGTVFRCPMLTVSTAAQAADYLKTNGVRLCGLTVNAQRSLNDYLGSCSGESANAFVLGNETTGLSDSLQAMLDEHLFVPMSNGVESLNVAVTAALIAYAGV